MINVLLDNNLKNEDYIGAITQQLSLLSIKYEFVDQIVPYSITWDCTEESLETDVLDRVLLYQTYIMCNNMNIAACYQGKNRIFRSIDPFIKMELFSTISK